MAGFGTTSMSGAMGCLYTPSEGGLYQLSIYAHGSSALDKDFILVIDSFNKSLYDSTGAFSHMLTAEDLFGSRMSSTVDLLALTPSTSCSLSFERATRMKFDLNCTSLRDSDSSAPSGYTLYNLQASGSCTLESLY